MHGVSMHCVVKFGETQETTTHLFPRHAEFDVVDANFDMLADDLAHLIRPVCKGCDAAHKLTISPRHFLAISQISRSRYVASINRVSDNDIEPLLCRGRSEAPF